MPSKSKIAMYWREEKAYHYLGYIMDWGEPSCWACGKWNENKDIDLNSLNGDEVLKAWNYANYLERCHIVPKAHGGCFCKANLVLLCKKCHKDSPDTKSPEIFINWVKNRKYWLYHEEKTINEAIEDLMFETNEFNNQIVLSKGFRNYVKQNAVLVGGKYSMSTIIACLIEYKKILNYK